MKLDGERMDKKIQQWQKIAIAACEQCGRNVVPEIRPLMKLQDWCAENDGALKLNLHPRAQYSIKPCLPFQKKVFVCLLVQKVVYHLKKSLKLNNKDSLKIFIRKSVCCVQKPPL